MANNTFKRSIAMLLVLNMLTGMLPIQALADEGNTEAPAITVTVTPSSSSSSSSEKKESAPAEKSESSSSEKSESAPAPKSESSSSEKSESAPAPKSESSSSEKSESAPAEKSESSSSEKSESAPAEKTESAEVASYDDNDSAKIEHDSNLTFGEKVEVEVTKDPVTTETNEAGATVETETTHVKTEGIADDGAEVKGEETFTQTTTTTGSETRVETKLEGKEDTNGNYDIDHKNDVVPDVEIPVTPGKVENNEENGEVTETTTTVENEDGSTTVTTTKTEEVKNEDGTSTTKTETTTETTTNKNDVVIENVVTESVEKKEEITNKDGTVTKTEETTKSEISSEVTLDKDGIVTEDVTTETFEKTEEVRNEDGTGIKTETTVTEKKDSAGNLIEGGSHVKVEEVINQIIGDKQNGENDPNYDFTDMTITVVRDVTTEILDVDAKITTDVDHIGQPDNYDGKQYNKLPNAGYTKDNPQRDGLYVPDGVIVNQGQTLPKEDQDAGYDFFLSGTGDATDAAAAVFKYIVYQKDENGNPIVDENGEYVIDEEKSHLIDGSSEKAFGTGMDFQTMQMILTNSTDGEAFYVYCADYLVETDQVPGHRYKMENLEDSGHYTEEDAAQLRAIVSNAYWGTDPYKYTTDENGKKVYETDEDGNKVIDQNAKGSIENVKSLLTEYAKKNPTVTVQDKNGNDVDYNLAELIGSLKEHEALAVSQAAIWAYSINRREALDGADKVTVVGAQSAIKCYNYDPKKDKTSWLSEYTPANDQSGIPDLTDEERNAREAAALESDARMKALFDCLMGLDPIDDSAEGVSTVINEKTSFDDVSLTIKDKVEDHAANNDDDDKNDVYNTELNFTLAFVPDQKNDDLLVYVLDEKGNKIVDENNKPIVKRLSGTNSEGREADTITPDENGVYTLTGLQLAEGAKFDLTIDGTQFLEDGVYLYSAQGGRLASQTFVGMAGGEQDVKVTMSLKFSVDEHKNVVATRKWRETSDPDKTPRDNPPPPAEYRMGFGVGQLEVIEEEVPLAAPPQTGDMSILWFAMIVMSGCGLCILNLLEKRKCRA